MLDKRRMAHYDIQHEQASDSETDRDLGNAG